MRRPHPTLFERIAWSTSRVYAQTVQRAKEVGLDVHPVAEWYDVDTAADLQRLENDLRTMRPEVARHTRATLGRLTAPQVGGTSSVGVRPDRSA
jgi:hypothetical protein